MSYDVVVSQCPQHAVVAVTGRPSVHQFLAMLHLMAVESESWTSGAVLFDLRGVEAVFSPQEQAEIGREVAISLAHIPRIASVVAEHRITRISERMAQRNGSNVRVFTREADAVAWLAAGPAGG